MWRGETETHIFCESAPPGARTWNQFFLPWPQLHHTYGSYAKQEGNSHFTTYVFPFALCRRIKELCSVQTPKQLMWTCVWWWWLCMCGEGHCICECVYVCAIMHACVFGSQGLTSAFFLFILLRQVFWLNLELTDRGVFLSLPRQFGACKSLKLHLILYLGARTGSHACTSSLPRGPSP